MRISLLCLLLLVALVAAHAHTSRADDGGWQKVYDHPAGAAKVIEMFDDEYGLAIIGTRIERTSDGGLTWEVTDTSEIGGGLIAIADRQHAWIASGSKMLHTGDGGLTWQRQEIGTPAEPFNGISVLSASEVWATAYDAPIQGYPPHGSSSLRHTIDGDATWQSVEVASFGIFLDAWFVGGDGWVLATQCHPGDPTDPASIDPPPCIDEDTLLHTTDDGRSWSALPDPAGGLERQIARVDTLLAYRVGRVAYRRGSCEAGCAGPQLYKTSDGGQTWSVVSSDSGGNDSINRIRFSSALDGWIEVTQLQPSTSPPSAPDFRIRLARTRDGGRSWAYVDLPNREAYAFDLTPTRVVTSARAGGIVLYDIEKGTWQQAVTDARPALQNLMFVTRERGYAVADSGDGHGTSIPWATEDGGASWEPLVTPEHLSVTSMTVDAWWATGDRPLYRSTDGGMSWQEVSLPHEADPKRGFRVQASVSDRIWLVAGAWLWRSEDAGVTWRGIDIEPDSAYHYIDADHGWTAACWPADCRHEIRVTSDGGDTWETRSIPASVSVEGFTTPLDGSGSTSDGAARGLRSRVVTHDGGVTWQTQAAPQPPPSDPLFGLIPVDDDRAFGIAYATDAHEWRISATRDGGASWANELDLGSTIGLPLAVVAHGRIWISFTSNDAGSDILGPPNHVTIYRKDIDPPPTAAATLPVEPPSHRTALLFALLAGLALVSALAAPGIAARRFR